MNITAEEIPEAIPEFASTRYLRLPNGWRAEFHLDMHDHDQQEGVLCLFLRLEDSKGRWLGQDSLGGVAPDNWRPYAADMLNELLKKLAKKEELPKL